MLLKSLRGAPLQSHNVLNGTASVGNGGLSMQGSGSLIAAVKFLPGPYRQQHEITVTVSIEEVVSVVYPIFIFGNALY